MNISVARKVALITGGTSGIGFATARELLRRNIKGVTIIGLNKQNGLRATSDLIREFGTGRILYCQADVTDKYQLEGAYQETIKVFKQLDIVINCAAICDDSVWKRQMEINLGGTINSTLLAFEKYLPKYKSGSEAVIINMSSTIAFDPLSFIPVYTSSKLAIVNFTRSFGAPEYYDKTKIRVLTICPGGTLTPLIGKIKTKGLFYDTLMKSFFASPPILQPPEYVAKGTVALILQGKHGSIWIIENEEPAFEISFKSRRDTRKQNNMISL